MRKLKQYFSQTILVILAVIVGYIVWQCLFIAKNTKVVQGNNASYVAMVLAAVFSITCLLCFLYQFTEKTEKRIIIFRYVLCSIIIVGQIAALMYVLKRNILPSTDLATNTNEAIEMLTTGKFAENSSASIYPFNRTHILILYFYYCFLEKIGINKFWEFSLPLSAIFMDSAIYFSYKIVEYLRGKHTATIFLALCVMSPITYLCIPYYYTSITGLPFMMAALYFAIKLFREKEKQKSILYGCLLGGITALGYRIRANGIYPLLALVVYCLMKGKILKENLKVLVVKIVSVVGIFLVVGTLWGQVIESYDEYDRTETAIPTIHSIMMSMQGQGGYSAEDFNFVLRYETQEEKKSACMEVIKERVKKLGVSGMVQLVEEKVKFTWAEGYCRLTNWYGNESKYITGYRRDILMVYCQIFRILLYVLILISVLKKIVKKNYDEILLPMIVMLGAFVSHIPIENNPQYCIPFLLTMFIISSDGLVEIQSGYRLKNVSERCIILNGVVAYLGIVIGVFTLFFAEYYDACVTNKYSLEEIVVGQGYKNSYLSLGKEGVEKISQDFSVDADFNSISIGVTVLDSSIIEEQYIMRLTDEKNNLICSKNFGVGQLSSNGKYVELEVGNIKVKGKERFSIEIEKYEKNMENSFAFNYEARKLDYLKSGIFKINDKGVGKQDMTMLVKRTYQTSLYSKSIYGIMYMGWIFLTMFNVCWIKRKLKSIKGEKTYDSI